MSNPSGICFMSGKGGVGKTTLSVLTSARLSQKRKKVLFLGLDLINPTASWIVAFAFKKDQATLRDILYGKKYIKGSDGWSKLHENLDQAKVSAGYGDIAFDFIPFLPPSKELKYIRNIASDAFSDFKFSGIIEGVYDYAKEKGYDHIIIDCPPSMGNITGTMAFGAVQCGIHIAMVNLPALTEMLSLPLIYWPSLIRDIGEPSAITTIDPAMTKHLFVVNSIWPDDIPLIRNIIEGKRDFLRKILETTLNEYIDEIAKNQIRRDWDVISFSGGDKTLKEALFKLNDNDVDTLYDFWVKYSSKCKLFPFVDLIAPSRIKSFPLSLVFADPKRRIYASDGGKSLMDYLDSICEVL